MLLFLALIGALAAALRSAQEPEDSLQAKMHHGNVSGLVQLVQEAWVELAPKHIAAAFNR